MGASAPASAEVIQSSLNPSLCMDWNTGTNKVALWTCSGSYNQNFFTSAYGQQRYGNLCLDGGGQGSDLIMAPCNATKASQRWTLVADQGFNSAFAAYRNEAGWCVDIPAGSAYQGQRLELWSCKWGLDWSRANQVWIRGSLLNAPQVAASTGISLAKLQSAPAGSYIPPKVIGAGAGNVIGAGAGNVIGAGAGNFVSADGGGMRGR